MKIKIGLLEDEQVLSNQLKKIIKEWAKDKGCIAEIKEYQSSQSFLFEYEENSFDLLFLDIVLPADPNGMEVAEIIRKKDNDVIIIFLTSNVEYMSEGYDVHALKYLLKPLRTPRIKQYLDKVYTIIENRKPAHYFYKSKKESAKILFRDILYFTNYTQHIEIHTKNAKYKEWKRLKDLEEVLPIEFVRCHRSFIVNIDAVQSIQPDSLQLINGESIPIGESFSKQVKDKWIYLYS